MQSDSDRNRPQNEALIRLKAEPHVSAGSPDATLGDRIDSLLDTSKFETAAAWKERVKSSQRLRYEAEAELVRRKLGDLETIRKSLGLSQRKICQLLLVDPSAWTRWTKSEESAPPHIYRMLQWYLAIEEKYPVLDVGFWLSTVSRVRETEQGLKLAENAQKEAKQAEMKAAETAARQDLVTSQVASLGTDLSILNREIVRLRHALGEAEEKAGQVSSELSKRFLFEITNHEKRSRRQNWLVLMAAIAESLIAGCLASIVL